MRCACIDIGSNTTRLLVAEAAHGRIVPLLQERVFTSIGRRIDARGAIAAAAIAETEIVVARQHATAVAAGAERIRAVATAAIRRATNRDALVAALRDHAGIEVAVLSSADEGRLAFAGATRTLDEPPAGTVAVVDVGGMSTEIAVGTLAGGVQWLRSFAIGSGQLVLHCRDDPPSEADIAAMNAVADAAFAGGRLPPFDDAVAVGGNAASLPRIVGPVLDGRALADALVTLRSAPAAELARRHDLAPERAVLLPAGILVLAAASRRLGKPLRIGCGGLREGVVLELAAGEG
jgi:exopolyphosphatase/guanosine-5'-triphosphate,3'-diphosphate pyrophosphatase